MVEALENSGTLLQIAMIADAGDIADESPRSPVRPHVQIAGITGLGQCIAASNLDLTNRIADRLGRREFRLYVDNNILGSSCTRSAQERHRGSPSRAANGLGFR